MFDYKKASRVALAASKKALDEVAREESSTDDDENWLDDLPSMTLVDIIDEMLPDPLDLATLVDFLKDKPETLSGRIGGELRYEIRSAIFGEVNEELVDYARKAGIGTPPPPQRSP